MVDECERSTTPLCDHGRSFKPWIGRRRGCPHAAQSPQFRTVSGVLRGIPTCVSIEPLYTARLLSLQVPETTVLSFWKICCDAGRSDRRLLTVQHVVVASMATFLVSGMGDG
jgi:hypothetical protein